MLSKKSISSFFATCSINIVNLVPTAMQHQFSKIMMLRICFHNLAVDDIQGSYVEFGVAGGNSLFGAIKANRASKFKMLGIDEVRRRFYGIDTFQSFQSANPVDDHPLWKGTDFSYDFATVKKRFRRYRDFVFLYKENVETLDQLDFDLLLGSETIAMLFLDLDLKSPTISALNLCKSRLNVGSFVVFDEFFGFKSDVSRGEFGAFEEFQLENPQFVFRELFTYGAGGVVFQLAEIKKSN